MAQSVIPHQNPHKKLRKSWGSVQILGGSGPPPRPRPPVVALMMLAQYAAGSMYRYGVRPSVSLSQLSTAATACGGFAAVGPAGRRHRSIAAARRMADISSTAVSCKGEQCHVSSRCRRLNTDLVCFCASAILILITVVVVNQVPTY